AGLHLTERTAEVEAEALGERPADLLHAHLDVDLTLRLVELRDERGEARLHSDRTGDDQAVRAGLRDDGEVVEAASLALFAAAGQDARLLQDVGELRGVRVREEVGALFEYHLLGCLVELFESSGDAVVL